MDITFNEFKKINEDMHIASKIKLRDSIHDIIVSELEPGEEMECDELSKKLKEKFKITISTEVIKHLLFVKWWREDDYTLFREKDKKWLGVWPYRNTIERKKRIKDPPLGKSRRKIKKEEDTKNTTSFYNRTHNHSVAHNRTNYNTGVILNKNKKTTNPNDTDFDWDDEYGNYWGW